MLKIFTNNKLLFIAIHILFGYLATFSGFSKLLLVLILGFGIVSIFYSKNENEEAFFMAAYLVGAEVFLRMTGGAVLYEIGKYGVALFLFLGLLIGKTKSQSSIFYIFYLLLLLLGIVFTQVPEGESIKNAIAFNLSGPITLGICALYFYHRKILKSELYEFLYIMILPVFSMVTYMYFRTPNLRELIFNTQSNFATSGGFGPNQVSTILGFGIFVLAVFLLSKVTVTGYKILDSIFLIYFTYRILITFSRGGFITAIIAIIFFSIFNLLYKKLAIITMLKYSLITIFFTTGIWLYASNVTKGMIDNRYTGKNASGKEKKDISSGRSDLFQTQIESFYEAPLFGIGVGNGKYKRIESGKRITAASHNEVSRLIEEHGLIGVVILLILILVPLEHFYNSNNLQKSFSISFFLFWFLTINHSAMRLVFPAFIYGLSLINIVEDE